MDKAILHFLFNHSYNLKTISDEERKFVLSCKGTALKVSPSDLKPLLTLKYPGFIYTDQKFYNKYRTIIYDSYFSDVFTPPRGYVGEDSILVVGIAPGESQYSFGEPKWLYGPSSKVLHSMLRDGYKWYFTNICKEPFPNNKENQEIIDKYFEQTLAEFKFFQKHKFIFLGKYEIFDKIIEKLNILYLRIPHPSYLSRKSLQLIEDIKKRIDTFISI